MSLIYLKLIEFGQSDTPRPIVVEEVKEEEKDGVNSSTNRVRIKDKSIDMSSWVIEEYGAEVSTDKSESDDWEENGCDTTD